MEKQLKLLAELKREFEKEHQNALKNPDKEVLEISKYSLRKKDIAETFDKIESMINMVGLLKTGIPKTKMKPKPEPYKAPSLPTDENGFSDYEIIE
jgi:hypothetical protein